MLKLTLLVTVVISFINFWFPATFEPVTKTGEKILGIRQTQQALNINTVQAALVIYCINHGKLPEKLNELYKSELLKEKFLDLDTHFQLKEGSEHCDFTLVPKS